jgi:hypothetical protein
MKRVKECVGTHEFLQVLPVLPVETPISLPDPVPSWVMPRPGRKEDDGIVCLNLEAGMGEPFVRSSEKTEITHREWGRRGRPVTGAGEAG